MHIYALMHKYLSYTSFYQTSAKGAEILWLKGMNYYILVEVTYVAFNLISCAENILITVIFVKKFYKIRRIGALADRLSTFWYDKC